MSDGYPTAVVRADGDDVSAWMARRGLPVEVVAGPGGWVSIEGLTPEDLDALAEMTRDLDATAVVLDTDGDALTIEVVGTDAAIDAAPDDAHALAAATGRPEAAGRVAQILGDAGLRPGERHRRVADLLGLPGGRGGDGSARARATGAPLERGGPAGPGRDAAPVQTGKILLPRWLPTILLWTGVVAMFVALAVAVTADHRRGLLAAGLCGLAGAACTVLGSVGRSTR
jgi:hypothetical protein